MEAGAPKSGESVIFVVESGNGSFQTAQPSGTQETVPTIAQCTTNANGQCTVALTLPAGSAGTPTVLDAETGAAGASSAPYPPSRAEMTVNSITSATPTRLVQTSSTRYSPGGQIANANIPGDVIKNTYTVYNCSTPNDASGNNTCSTGTQLQNVSLTVSVDHGFFTNSCAPTIGGVVQPATYANCSFNATPAAGTQAGDVKSNGTTETVTTDNSGSFTVWLGIANDPAFSTQSGNLVARVSVTGNGATGLAESTGNGNSPSSTNCTAVAQNTTANSANGANPANNNSAIQAGCPTGTPWTTDAAPLNGSSAKIVSVPNASSEAPLTDGTTTNNIPANDSNGNATGKFRTFKIVLLDQFQNETTGGADPSDTSDKLEGLPYLQSTGVGNISHCVNSGGAQAYNSGVTCNNASNYSNAPGASANGTGPAETTSTNSSGVSTGTFVNVRGSYDNAFSSSGTPTQDRYIAYNDSTFICNPNCSGTGAQFGTQTIKLTWDAPQTTFNTYSPATSVSPAVATYNPTNTTAGSDTSFKTLTDTVVINWYNQNSRVSATFTTTPSNTVPAGTVVTVSAKVIDQNNQPVQGDSVTFVRSGPNPNNGTDCSATNGQQNTNASGQAGFTFTCNTPGTQTVTVVVTDGSGNELARGTQTITFTNGTTPPPGSGFKTMPGYRSGSTDVLGNLNGGVVSSVKFGNSGDRAVFGDWNGDGTVTAGVFRPSTGMWYLTNDNHSVAITVRFGQSGDKPVVGDWNGDGTTGIGVYRPSTQTFFLANGFSGAISAKLKFGNRGDVPVVGDWDKAGQTKVGVYRPSNGTFYRIDHSGLKFGNAGDHPVAGDWNGDGITTIGVIRGSHWYLTDDNKTVSYSFNFGTSSTDFTYSNGASSAATVDNG
jgi:hypothetical protein